MVVIGMDRKVYVLEVENTSARDLLVPCGHVFVIVFPAKFAVAML